MPKNDLSGITRYTIFRTMNTSKVRRIYQIDKRIFDEVMDSYLVEIKPGGVFCSCPGFLRQKYPAREHKHVRVALDFIERGEPEGAEYKLKGTGINTEIEVIQ